MGEAQGEDERAYWLALLRLPGIGAAGARALLSRFGTPRRLFEAGDAAWHDARLPAAARVYLANPAWAEIDTDLIWLRQPHRHLLILTQAAYPPLLREIPDPPPVLFVQGDPALLHAPQLAVVGSRNPSPGGERTAADFAGHLSRAGLAITSGMAVGIDAAAHRGALQATGFTLAVAGTGLDRVYPAHHRELAHAIAEQGALVSEFPAGTPPRPDHFPRRNRIISGLTLGTLVVEAAPQSGSLITARLAADQGREVFAIPGSIHNPLSRGCHALIRQGAKLVETAQDILEELPGFTPILTNFIKNDVRAGASPDDVHQFSSLLNSLGFEPTSIDAVVERSGLTTEQVSSMLVVLELHGKVVSGPGGLYTRMP
ncbi:MAG: DNA-processing protein DprA [Pseudomonadota bacterium]